MTKSCVNPIPDFQRQFALFPAPDAVLLRGRRLVPFAPVLPHVLPHAVAAQVLPDVGQGVVFGLGKYLLYIYVVNLGKFKEYRYTKPGRCIPA